MAPTPLPVEALLARQVKSDELSPHQQTTSRGFKTAPGFYQQVILKHPYLSAFHSHAEYLHAIDAMRRCCANLLVAAIQAQYPTARIRLFPVAEDALFPVAGLPIMAGEAAEDSRKP